MIEVRFRLPVLIFSVLAVFGTDNARSQEPLASQLNAMKSNFEHSAPPSKISVYNQGIALVQESGVTQTAKAVGDSAPDFTLPSATGDKVRLSSLAQQGPVILTWYRRGWCPYCNLQLREYQKHLTEFSELGATLVAISPELPDKSLSTKERDTLSYIVLSDVGNTVSRKYGIVYTLPDIVKKEFLGRLNIPEYNGDDTWDLPLAATYVVGSDLKIQYAFLDADYRVRAEPSALLDALKKMRARK